MSPAPEESRAEREQREMDEWVARAIAEFPPITEETRQRIVRLLSGF